MTKKTYTAAVLVIGNEILSGRTHDTNSTWIAEKMTQCGIDLREIRVIPDDTQQIIDSVSTFKNTYDYVFTTGGIGPTHDDITAEAIAKVFKVKLQLNKEADNTLKEHYGLKDYIKSRQKMAMIPIGAELIPNPISAAPGFKLENVYVFAGVPKIMQAMLDHVITTLEGGDLMLSNTIACQIPESEIAEGLDIIQRNYTDVSIGSYPNFRVGGVGVSVVLRSIENDILARATNDVIDLIKQHGDEPRALSLMAEI